MPKVGNKKFPYTTKGKKMAKTEEARMKAAKRMKAKAKYK